MAGAYLLAILGSAAGIVMIDLRLKLAILVAPVRTAVAVAVGTAFLLAWDLVGITAGVFVKGDSPMLLGPDLAPHLPLEEPFFLAFLAYLALVVWAGAMRRLDRRRETRAADDTPTTAAPRDPSESSR